MDWGDDFGFCPSKLFRDDPEFTSEMRHFYLCWKMGQMPNGESLGTMTEAQASNLGTLIRHWEMLTRAEDFQTLGTILGGSKES